MPLIFQSVSNCTYERKEKSGPLAALGAIYFSREAQTSSHCSLKLAPIAEQFVAPGGEDL